MKRAIVPAALLLLLPAVSAGGGLLPLAAGERVAILVIPAGELRQIDEELSGVVARALRGELERRGFDTVVLPRSVEEMDEDGITDVVDAAWIVEIVASDGRASSLGGVAGEGTIDRIGIGGEISIVRSELSAELRVWDGRSLELLGTLHLDSRATTPTLSGIGIGRRGAGIRLSLPWYGTYSRAARSIARQAVAIITTGRELERAR
ncbi:MAG TPA: hypothetical protein VMS56_11440 [Thermoanaerobaculia bacterium]|nr:hypothetical protein [Thermoanaerobaculia bacterium]